MGNDPHNYVVVGRRPITTLFYTIREFGFVVPVGRETGPGVPDKGTPTGQRIINRI